MPVATCIQFINAMPNATSGGFDVPDNKMWQPNGTTVHDGVLSNICNTIHDKLSDVGAPDTNPTHVRTLVGNMTLHCNNKSNCNHHILGSGN